MTNTASTAFLGPVRTYIFAANETREILIDVPGHGPKTLEVSSDIDMPFAIEASASRDPNRQPEIQYHVTTRNPTPRETRQLRSKLAARARAA